MRETGGKCVCGHIANDHWVCFSDYGNDSCYCDKCNCDKYRDIEKMPKKERYTIERGDYGLFFYDQKRKKELSLEDVGDILNGMEFEGLIKTYPKSYQEIIYAQKQQLIDKFIVDLKSKNFYKVNEKLIKKWEDEKKK